MRCTIRKKDLEVRLIFTIKAKMWLMGHFEIRFQSFCKLDTTTINYVSSFHAHVFFLFWGVSSSLIIDKSMSLSYLSGPSQTQKNQGEGDLHTRVAGPANLATEGKSKRSHWCSLLDCLPSAIEPDANNIKSNFIVLQFVLELV